MKRKHPVIGSELSEISDLSTLAKRCKEEETDISYARVRDAYLTEEDLSELRFEGVMFENCRFIHTSFKRSSFIDVVFKSCDLSNSSFKDGYFSRCELCSVKGVGTSFGNASLWNFAMIDSNFRYADFNSVKFRSCEIIQCDISEAFFTECMLKDVVFDQSIFHRTSFFKTSLNKIDLSTNQIEGIMLSQDASEIKGASVNLYQAAELAKMMGVIIK